MTNKTKSKVVKIGNSRGIRIPRLLLEQAGLDGDVEMVVQGGKLVISTAQNPRQGWEAQFEKMAEKGADRMIDEAAPTDWDDKAWVWCSRSGFSRTRTPFSPNYGDDA